MKLMRSVFEVDEEEMARLMQPSAGFGIDLAIKRKLWDPACHVLVEDYAARSQTPRYGVWAPGLHIALKGTIQVEYWSSYSMGNWVSGKFVAEPGDAYMLDKGDQIRFTVLSDIPYRHLGILMPAHAFAAEPDESVRPEGEVQSRKRDFGKLS